MTVKKSPAKVLSVYELIEMFPDEQSAIAYLAPILWPDGPVCPYCQGRRIKARTIQPYYRCNHCLKTFTIRVGTIFERSHIPLHKWLYAMYAVVTSRKGISSVQLSKEIGVTQKSAWFLLQRIRAACGNQTKRILSGIVEVDEVYLGGLEKNKHSSRKLKCGRGTVGKTPLIGVRDREGQVVVQEVLATDKTTLCQVVRSTVALGSTVCTDEFASYRGLGTEFDHQTVNHSAKQFVDSMASGPRRGAKAHTNGIESVWAILKRGFYGIYHIFSRKHTGLYVNEFVFRLNEGNCNLDTVDRLDSLVKGVVGQRLTYEMLKYSGIQVNEV